MAQHVTTNPKITFARPHLLFRYGARLCPLRLHRVFAYVLPEKLFGTPHLSWLAHIHGVVFTAWAVFLVCQTTLVAAGRIELHRRLGWAGVVLAVGILVLGTVMTFHSVRAGYASGRPGVASLLLNAMIDLFLFGIFFAAGLFFLRKKEIHKRLMVLAMLSLIIPAIARLPIPPSLIGWMIFAFSMTGIIYDVVVLRRVYLTNIVSAMLINGTTPLRFIIADTRVWQNFAEWLVR
jgi:hypothetical protein